ncbi:MAG: hypothetical protein JSW41_02230 [Candidatus Aenigmatarchaeota archaeon]|nr:MAG: hypothetical protein JSW41_02230 [Candidatus Aenigmarchaeota archaeon]
MPEAPQITPEQIQELDNQIREIKKCIPSIDIQAKAMEDGIYNVEYGFIPPGTCTNTEMAEFFTTQGSFLIIQANLNSNSAEAIKGKMTGGSAQTQMLISQMETAGNCGGISLLFMASSAVQIGSVQPQTEVRSS